MNLTDRIRALKERLAAGAASLLDPEIRRAGRIMRAALPGRKDGGSVVSPYDKVFTDRLAKNPKALKMSFWEGHFEWRSLAGYPQINGRILDFGCGSGHSDIFLARSGRNVHGIDMSPVGIAIAKDLLDREEPGVRGRLSFALADVSSGLPGGAPFDSAWASHVFEHIEDPGPVMDGLRRWLKPGAYLLISVPLGRAYDDPGHVCHFFDADQFRSYMGRHSRLIERADVSEEHRVLRIMCRFV